MGYTVVANKKGLAEARPHMARYTRGIHGSATARDAIMKSESIDAIEEIFKKLCSNQ